MNAFRTCFSPGDPKRKMSIGFGTETGACLLSRLYIKDMKSSIYLMYNIYLYNRFPFPCHSVVGSDRQSEDHDFGDRSIVHTHTHTHAYTHSFTVHEFTHMHTQTHRHPHTQTPLSPPHYGPYASIVENPLCVWLVSMSSLAVQVISHLP